MHLFQWFFSFWTHRYAVTYWTFQKHERSFLLIISNFPEVLCVFFRQKSSYTSVHNLNKENIFNISSCQLLFNWCLQDRRLWQNVRKRCDLAKFCFNRFYFYFGTIRPTDEEATTIEKIICYTLRPPKKEGHTRNHWVWPWGRRSTDYGPDPLLWFLQEGTGKAG